MNGLANALEDLGIKRGDRVSIIQHNCPQLMESILCCFRAGFAAVPINVRLTANEFSYIVKNSRSSALIFGPEFAEVARSISAEMPSLRLISVSGNDNQVLPYEKLIAGYPEERPRTEVTLR